MNIVRSVEKALAEWEMGDYEAAMLHATNAVDGSASKSGRSTKRQFLAFVRRHYAIIQAMLGAATINVHDSVFGQLPEIPGVMSPTEPDLADIIYAAHRCSHQHGADVPAQFAILEGGNMVIHLGDTPGIQLPAAIIIGLLASAVMCAENRGLGGGGECYLTWNHPGAGEYAARNETLLVREWWGRKRDFLALVGDAPQSTFTVTQTGEYPIQIAHKDLPITFMYDDPADGGSDATAGTNP